MQFYCNVDLISYMYIFSCNLISNNRMCIYFTKNCPGYMTLKGPYE